MEEIKGLNTHFGISINAGFLGPQKI